MGSLRDRVSAEPRAQKGPCPSSQTGQALCVCRDPFKAIFLLPANQSHAETSSAHAGLKARVQDCDLATISPVLNPLKTPHPPQPSQAEPLWWRPCSFWQGLITEPLGVVRFALPEGAEDLKNEMGASHEVCLLKFHFLILSAWNLAGYNFSGAQLSHPLRMVIHRTEHLSCSEMQESKFLCEPGGKGGLGHCTGLQEL